MSASHRPSTSETHEHWARPGAVDPGTAGRHEGGTRAIAGTQRCRWAHASTPRVGHPMGATADDRTRATHLQHHQQAAGVRRPVRRLCATERLPCSRCRNSEGAGGVEGGKGDEGAQEVGRPGEQPVGQVDRGWRAQRMARQRRHVAGRRQRGGGGSGGERESRAVGGSEAPAPSVARGRHPTATRPAHWSGGAAYPGEPPEGEKPARGPIPVGGGPPMPCGGAPMP